VRSIALPTALSFRITLLALPFLVAACGGSGAPTKADIQQVVTAKMAEANRTASNNSLGLLKGPYDVNEFSVTGADCTARENGIYRCAVTAQSKSGTNTSTLSFKKTNGVWTLVS
jgi:hypothetical protein